MDLKNKEWCFLCKWRQHAWRNSLFENYELSFRRKNEVSTNGSGNAHRVGFYTISYVRCLGEWCQGVNVDIWYLWKIQRQGPLPEFNIQEVSWTGSITNSSPYTPIQVHQFLSDIFWKYAHVFSTHSWGDGSTHVWLPSWCVMHLATHEDLLNLSRDSKMQFDYKLNLTSARSKLANRNI